MIVLGKIKKLFFILVVTLFVTNSYAATQNEYVGSRACEKCHQKTYKEWGKTLHAKMIQDVRKNPKAIVGDFKTKSDIRTFGKEGIIYTIGNQWKQRYIIKKEGELYILPAQYHLETGEWKPYHPKDWDKRPWLKKCAQCHVTGLDYEKKTFVESGVGCESCHGPGKAHAQNKKKSDFAKTIVNPSSLAVGLQVQICGSCHTRGKDLSGKHGYPKDFKPGDSLHATYKSVNPKDDAKRFWPNGSSKAHHQQYLDWEKSTHAKQGVTCISCHTVHSTGSATRYQTRLPGNKLCLNCHTPSSKPTLTHSIHDFGSCIGCHMPKFVKSAESGDLHDHTFVATLPKTTIKHGGLDKQPNSCNTCHYHKDDKPEELQKVLDAIKKKKRLGLMGELDALEKKK